MTTPDRRGPTQVKAPGFAFVLRRPVVASWSAGDRDGVGLCPDAGPPAGPDLNAAASLRLHLDRRSV